MDQVCQDIKTHLTAARQNNLWEWEKTWKLSKQTVTHLLVPAVFTNGSRPINASDFSAYIPAAEKCLHHLSELLKVVCQKLVDSHDEITADPALTGLLVLLRAEHSTAQHWTSNDTLRLAEEVIQTWMSALGQRSTAGLLSRDDSYKHAVAHLLPILDHPDWKCNPAAVQALTSIIHNTDLLKLRDGEQRIMIAVSLRLIDDFELTNLETGILCLHRIVSIVPSGELRPYYLVMVDALKSLLSRREASVVRILIPCAVDLFDKLERRCEGNARRPYDIPFTWSQRDSFMVSVLDAMQWEDGGHVTTEYLKTLPLLISSSAVIAHRFSKQVLTVCERYIGFQENSHLEQHKAINRLAVDMVIKLIASIGEDVHLYSDQLCLMLLKKKLSLCHRDQELDSDSLPLVQAIQQALDLLQQYDLKTWSKYNALLAGQEVR